MSTASSSVSSGSISVSTSVFISGGCKSVISLILGSVSTSVRVSTLLPVSFRISTTSSSSFWAVDFFLVPFLEAYLFLTPSKDFL